MLAEQPVERLLLADGELAGLDTRVVPEFYNKKVTARLQELGVYQTTVPLYHPQANLTERSNETLKTMISTFVKADHRTWDVHLAEFAFALNTMKQGSTKYSPAFLNFGRNPVPPKNLRTEAGSQTPTIPITTEDWADRMKRLPAIHDLVKAHLDTAWAKQSKNYDKGKRLRMPRNVD